MALQKSETADILKEFSINERDTSSPQVQIALLTKRLQQLNDHFKEHKKDHHSRFGLLKLVGQRRRLLRFLQKNNTEEYKTLITKLGIRK